MSAAIQPPLNMPRPVVGLTISAPEDLRSRAGEFLFKNPSFPARRANALPMVPKPVGRKGSYILYH